ncbi:MAG: hypothetical protein ACLFUK_03025 [Halanaerobium sp.]
MDKFKKKTFKGPKEFIKELKFILKNRAQIKRLEAGDLIDAKFMQRLMMAVTGLKIGVMIINEGNFCKKEY